MPRSVQRIVQQFVRQVVITATTLSLALVAACATDSTVGPGSPALARSSEGTPQTQASPWTVSLMTLPAGFTQGAAYQINSAGTIVGEAWNGAGIHQPILWTGGVPALVSVPAGFVGGWLSDISDAGAMVGSAQDAQGATHAFRATASVVTALNDVGAGSSATAIGGPSNAYIVGSFEDASGNDLPVRWSARFGTYTLLPLPSGRTGGWASDINATGDIVGSVYDGAGHLNGYLWKADGTTKYIANYPSSNARTIAPDGTIGFEATVVGISAPPYVANTVLWSIGNVWSINALDRVVGNESGAATTWRSGVKTPLPTILGQSYAWARGINSCGTIVGQVGTALGDRPLRWTRIACE